MEQHYRKVINLYREFCEKRNVSPERILEVQKELASCITAARIQNSPTEDLENLMNDVVFLNSLR